ncbi:glycogen synthase [Echinimonas agarilytica]|uniref:Glycogen synthase n=1 Tax=Echinimonas agarilytica TaxID=1215918 RepID=A0AA41W947_9GAMM|nr:glycogen synthase [Echinimonas agarilytica]MCM2681364.1 glycogen synthase [Echinimonas agarilytica]
MRVLFLASEVDGLIKTGGLADVAKVLPIELQKRDIDVSVMLPCYPQVKALVVPGEAPIELTMHLGSQHYIYRIYKISGQEVPVYAIDYEPYFNRDRPYDDGNHGYADNGERFAFFTLAALQACQMLNLKPNIVHSNDWHTALAPFFIKTVLADNSFFAETRSVLSIHNGAYQGSYDLNSIPFAHTFSQYTEEGMYDSYNMFNFLKCGVLYADAINAVSKSYAEELTTPLGGHYMSHIFQRRKDALVGILNGCDYGEWDTENDPHLIANYSATDLSGKAKCKQDLQQQLNLPEDPNLPLFAMVSRFTDQKGFSLLVPALADFLASSDAQVAIVGSGETAICDALTALAKRYPNRFGLFIGYSDALSHQAQAGADYFLMPSIFEPCGLTQMFSLAYGSLPVAREVGGLKDTVIGYNGNNLESANGITFLNPEPDALYYTMRAATDLYNESPEIYLQIQQRAMATRFLWEKSSAEYIDMYNDVLTHSH